MFLNQYHNTDVVSKFFFALAKKLRIIEKEEQSGAVKMTKEMAEDMKTFGKKNSALALDFLEANSGNELTTADCREG